MKFFTQLFGNKQEYTQAEHALVILDESLHNITEGSEFLDDAIRMNEQPFMHSPIEERGASFVYLI